MFIDNVWDNINAIYDTSDSNVGIWRNKGRDYVLNLTTFEYHEASNTEIARLKPEKAFYKGWL